MFVLLPTMKMTSKCSKLYNETTCLQLVVPHVISIEEVLESWPFGLLVRRKAKRGIDSSTVNSLIYRPLYIHHTHGNSLRPHQVHSHYKRIFLFHLLHKYPSSPLLNLHLTTHACKSPFSTLRCPSMTVSLKLFFNTKPTDKHHYLLCSSCRLFLVCVTDAS